MPPYVSTDIAVVVPTYNRPGKLGDLLESLATQTNPVGEVVVVSAGQHIASVIRRYSERLKLKHFHVAKGGQIAQRNRGITVVSEDMRLIISFDDDIVAEQDAIERIVDRWNRAPANCAGIAFNMVNETRHNRRSWQVRLGILPREPGRVSRAGVNSSVSSLDRDIRSRWLPGGATSWRKEILERHVHRPIPSAWAVYEDLMFSYPLGKELPLLVCAGARVRHEHTHGNTGLEYYCSRGYGTAVWRRVFVRRNPDMSLVAYVVATTVQGIGLILNGLPRSNRGLLRIGWGLGMLKGVFVSIL